MEFKKPYYRQRTSSCGEEHKAVVYPPQMIFLTHFILHRSAGEGAFVRAGPLSYRQSGAWLILFGTAGANGDTAVFWENIYKELSEDLAVVPRSATPKNGADQGVPLLNTVLTVRAHQANSHQKLGAVYGRCHR